MELLVSMMLVSIALGAVVNTLMSQRRLFEADMVRTRVNQTVRGAYDVIGLAVRQAGENLPRSYPAIILENGVDGAPDVLTIRRHVLDEVLSVCTSLPAGASHSTITVALPNAEDLEPGCIIENVQRNYNSWQQYRVANGGTAVAYVFDQATKVGQFVTYSGESSSGTGMTMNLQSAATWATTYNTNSSDIYLIEELEFSLDADGYLVMTQRGLGTAGGAEVENRLAHGVSDFQVRLERQDGTILDSLTENDDWTDVSSIEIAFTTDDQEGRTQLDRKSVARFFPRNALSK
jgi:hypothetical protein